MVTVSVLLSVVIIPIIIATAAFGLAVEDTEKVMKKAGTAIMQKFHKKPVVTNKQ